MTGWNHGLHGIRDMQFAGEYEQCPYVIPMLPVEHLQLADPGTGIYVRAQRTEPAESAYYLVSHTVNGAEDFANLTPGGNTTGSVTESAGPGLVIMWREEYFPDGWYYSGDRNPTIRDYVRWESPPYWNVPSRPCNYRLGFPQTEYQLANPGMDIELHALFGNYDGWREWNHYEEGALLFTLSHLRYNSYTAFNECMTTLRPWDEGTAQPYFYARALSFIHDYAADAYNLDPGTDHAVRRVYGRRRNADVGLAQRACVLVHRSGGGQQHPGRGYHLGVRTLGWVRLAGMATTLLESPVGALRVSLDHGRR